MPSDAKQQWEAWHELEERWENTAEEDSRELRDGAKSLQNALRGRDRNGRFSADAQAKVEVFLARLQLLLWHCAEEMEVDVTRLARTKLRELQDGDGEW